MFKKYHYLSHSFNKAARVFLCYCNDVLVGFNAILPFPHPIKKNTWREHRLVVFPDFQGVGIGSRFSALCGEILKDEGKTFIATTSNPALIFSRKKDNKWITTRIGRTSRGSKNGILHNKNVKNSTSANRITVSFQYKG